MWVLVQPLDVLFFRKARPFDTGEGSWAEGAVLPGAYPFAGAFRSRMLATVLAARGLDFQAYARGDPGTADLVEALGPPGGYGELRLRGPFLCEWGGGDPSVFLPLPLNLLGAGAGVPRAVALRPLQEGWPGMRQTAAGGSPALLPLWVRQEEALPELPAAVVAAGDLGGYLLGYPEVRCRRLDKLYEREVRVGIGLDQASRTAREGRLYAAEFLRLHPGAGFLAELQVPEGLLAGEGLVALGGESRAARFRRLDGAGDLGGLVARGDEMARAVSKHGGRFSLYLAAPAVFDGGWLPGFLDRATLEGELDGIRIALRAAAVGKPVPLGGWDLAAGWPKPMYRAVPAGSVFFFELREGRAEDVCRLFWFTARLQECSGRSGMPELAKVGFGLTLVGTWDYA